MSDIKHTMSLDDRRFAAGFKRAENRTVAGVKRIATSIKDLNKSVSIIGNMSQALGGLAAGAGILGGLGAAMRTFSDLTRDASGSMTRLGMGFRFMAGGFGSAFEDLGVTDRVSNFLKGFADPATMKGMRDTIRRETREVRDAMEAERLRAIGDVSGAERLEEAAKNRANLHAIEQLEKRQAFADMGKTDPVTRQLEAARNAARLSMIAKEEAKRNRIQAESVGIGAFGDVSITGGGAAMGPPAPTRGQRIAASARTRRRLKREYESQWHPDPMSIFRDGRSMAPPYQFPKRSGVGAIDQWRPQPSSPQTEDDLRKAVRHLESIDRKLDGKARYN